MPAIYSSDDFVIYTADNGNPSTEYYAPPPGQAQKTYTVPMTGVIPTGATITAAWYALLDNIGNSMTCFAHIAVSCPARLDRADRRRQYHPTLPDAP